MSNSKRMLMRENVIANIYSTELLNAKPNPSSAFEDGDLTDKEIKLIESIASKYDTLKKIVVQFTKESWPWERIAPLTRAILIYGAFEMNFADKALVINIMVEYAKEYIPDETYKFINSILDKVGGLYERNKASKKDA